MENPEVAQLFEEIADLLEIQNANPFRVRAYRNAARTVRDLAQPLKEMTALDELPGIGKDLADKITTILKTGDLPMRQELYGQVPKGLLELLKVPGLGPKKARSLYEELQIDSLDKLRQAAEQHRISVLKGFGAKTEEKILQSLQHLAETGKRFYLAEAKVFADAVVRHLQQTPGVKHLEVAGSFRRRRETVADLDLLATCKEPGPVMDRLAEYEAVAEVMARGPTKMTVRLRNGLQMDLRVVPEESYGAALVYFTGSKAHNIVIRRMAQERDLKINEYGVFRDTKRSVGTRQKAEGSPEAASSAGLPTANCQLPSGQAGLTEADVYKTIDLPWIPPELREDRGEIALAQQGRLPKLLELDDLHGDLHVHTNATDGRASLEEMVEAARKRGHDYIAITDHSKRVTMARGLDAHRLREQWKAIDKLAGTVKGITILKGVEMDILEDGRMDLPDDVLAEADWVIASIHYGQSQPREKITKRLLNAIANPYVNVIGHPTGRLIGQPRATISTWTPF